MLSQKTNYFPIFLLILLWILSACTRDSFVITHIHGLGYSADGNQLIIPSHEGLVAFENKSWKNVKSPKHDYMGFQMVDSGFYSSGHPNSRSSLLNPLGIVKSSDNGISLEFLNFYGETDFHDMAVGYYNHTIYVINPVESAELPKISLYYSIDDAKTWKESKLSGVNQKISQIAVHPTNGNIVALGTQNGLFLSTNHGDSFQTILSDIYISSVYFTIDGQLRATSQEKLMYLKLTPNYSMVSFHEILLSMMDSRDIVRYISQNPHNHQDLSIATENKSVYRTLDDGKTWTKIMSRGKLE